MARVKYIYWCISYQQYVAPRALEKLQEQLHCKIVRLNLVHFGQVDFQKFSTWINSQQLSRHKLT